MKSSILICTFLALSAVVSLPALGAEDPIVKGTTTYIDSGVYMPLDGVQVTVVRKSPLDSKTSMSGGKFGIQFAAGTPVHVLFEGPDGLLPQLQSLSADKDIKHDVHVTLFTVEEAKRQRINAYAYVKAIIDQLIAAGVEETSKELLRLKELLRKLG
jgi:hypothetical protein